MTSLRYPLEIGRNGRFAVDVSDVDKARSRIMSSVVTAIGERVMRPDFGTDLMQAYYLSGEDVISAVEDSIGDIFSKMSAEGYWRDISLQSVEATLDPRSGGSTVFVDVRWSLGGTVVTTSDVISVQTLIQENEIQ